MAEVTSYTKEERELADRLDRALQDRLAHDEWVKRESHAEGHAEGIKQERKKAYVEKLEIANKLLALDISAEDVSDATDLPIGTVKDLL